MTYEKSQEIQDLNPLQKQSDHDLIISISLICNHHHKDGEGDKTSDAQVNSLFSDLRHFRWAPEHRSDGL